MITVDWGVRDFLLIRVGRFTRPMGLVENRRIFVSLFGGRIIGRSD